MTQIIEQGKLSTFETDFDRKIFKVIFLGVSIPTSKRT